MTQLIEPCPFCGGAVRHVTSLARAFREPRTYHEYHHTCSVLDAHWFFADDEHSGGERAAWVRAWNCRPAAEQAVSVKLKPLGEEAMTYITMYLSGCRDCADDGPICPSSGIACGGHYAAAQHAVSALNYGWEHGFIEKPFVETDKQGATRNSVSRLRWVQKGQDYYANTLAGTYSIGRVKGTFLAVLRSVVDDKLTDVEIGYGCSTLAEALSWAQEDFANRVNSAFI